MDSTFKRGLFLALISALGILLLYFALFYGPTKQQQTVVLYLIILQVAILITFYSFRNQHAYRMRSVKKLKNPRLQENSFLLSDLLLKDYAYIKDTCNQAMNDRHTMINYFLIITGAIITIVATNLRGATLQEATTRYMLMLVSIFLNFIGWVYFMHIIRLRQAWHGSALAMNQIKEFFIQNGRVPDEIARSAFLWDTKSVPAAGRKSNVFYYSTMLISAISSIVLIFASYISQSAGAFTTIPTFSWLLGLYHFVFMMVCYSLFLDYARPRTIMTQNP